MTSAMRLSARDMRVALTGAAVGIIATVLAVLVSAQDDDPVPATPAMIEEAVRRLSPDCQMIARRSLRQSLNTSRQAWISSDELDILTGPLARGGAETCDAINEQRFSLGEV